MRAARRLATAFAPLAVATPLAAAVLVASGCATEPTLGEVSSSSTVADLVGSGCTTAVVLGLARQIADEIDCTNPGALVPFEAAGNISFASSAVLPYLQADALADLLGVAQTNRVQINSAFRTLPQQYLLYRWYVDGRCGIAAAATVGTSNHETARAIDLTAYPLATLAASGWSHDVPSDDPHFDHTMSADLRGADTLAFQRLWNRNHAEDPIAEDGKYGAQTEARLRSAPATGFAQGAQCAPPPAGDRIATAVSIDGPDRAPPMTRTHFSLAISNAGHLDWSSATRLVVADGSSLLHDPSWASADVITTLGLPMAAGEIATVDFDVMTPAATEETVVSERLVLEDAGVRFGSIEIALTVVPGASEPTSGEGSEPPNTGGGGVGPSPESSGGCAVGGHGSGLIGVLVGLWLRRRPRLDVPASGP